MQTYFNLTTAILLTAIGLSGNFVVLFVLRRKAFQKETLFRYYFLATFSDILNVLFIWTNSQPNVFFINTYTIVYKLNSYLTIVVYSFSHWIIMISSVDRYIAVKWPTKFLFRKNIKYQILTTFFAFAMLTLAYKPYFLNFDIYGDENQTYCGYNSSEVSNFTLIFIDSLLCF